MCACARNHRIPSQVIAITFRGDIHIHLATRIGPGPIVGGWVKCWADTAWQNDKTYYRKIVGPGVVANNIRSKRIIIYVFPYVALYDKTGHLPKQSEIYLFYVLS